MRYYDLEYEIQKNMCIKKKFADLFDFSNDLEKYFIDYIRKENCEKDVLNFFNEIVLNIPKRNQKKILRILGTRKKKDKFNKIKIELDYGRDKYTNDKTILTVFYIQEKFLATISFIDFCIIMGKNSKYTEQIVQMNLFKFL